MLITAYYRWCMVLKIKLVKRLMPLIIQTFFHDRAVLAQYNEFQSEGFESRIFSKKKQWHKETVKLICFQL